MKARDAGAVFLKFAGVAGLRFGVIALALLPLLLGGAVMLCGEYEKVQGTVLPRYLWDDEELVRKHLYTMAPSLEFIADRYGSLDYDGLEAFRKSGSVLAPMWRAVQENGLSLRGHAAAIRDLNDYKNSLEPGMLVVKPAVARSLFAAFLEKKYAAVGEELLTSIRNSNDVPGWLIEAYPDEGDRMAVLDSLEKISLAAMNNDLGANYRNYDEVPVRSPGYIREPRWIPPDSPEWRMWGDFVRGLPSGLKWMPTKQVYWRHFLRRKYDSRIEHLNSAWGTSFEGFSVVPCADGSMGALMQDDWHEFVWNSWPRSMIRLPEGYDDEWRKYLEARLVGRDGMLAEVVTDDTGAFISLPLVRPQVPWMDLLWCDFVESRRIPADEIRLVTHKDAFGPFLRSNYLGGRIVSLNEEWATGFEVFDDVPLPLGLSDLSLFPALPEQLRKEYALSAWSTALRTLGYPSGIIERTAWWVGGLTLGSLLLSVLTGYILARVPVRSTARFAAWCIVASLVPVSIWLVSGQASLAGAMGSGRFLTLCAGGISMFTAGLFRQRFLSIIKSYMEPARLQGVGELGFIFRFVIRYSWPVFVYGALLHFMCIYCSVDWQVLAMGRLWNWTLGVWAVNLMGSPAPVRAAAAVIGMIPLIIATILVFPVLTRYGLVPRLRRGNVDE